MKIILYIVIQMKSATATLVIRIPKTLDAQLRRESSADGVSRSAVVRDALRRNLAIRRLERIRARLVPRARRKGFLTDEDIFRAVS